ncbi:hypothetical protein FACS1894190_08910 [Spirochaetia bacterium]|nr:hypothetical protein FACS1894190_08910 [Spirochaetia bacterium]
MVMIGFTVKKTFLDLWDNALRISLINLLFIALAAIIIVLQWLLRPFPVLSALVVLLGIIMGGILMCCTTLCVSAISDYETFGTLGFKTNLRPSLKNGILMGLFYGSCFIAFSFVMPFYLMLNSMFGLLIACLLFWFFFASCVALQFFFSLRRRENYGIKQSIKRCFLIFVDNPLFCLFCFLFSIFLFAISAVTGFIFPGAAGVMLFLDEALRLRLLKYNQSFTAEANRAGAKINWYALLSSDIEKTGSRSLKSLFFPWKD